ncbi:uncharacterized protein LODBEIA_P40740 [Lodderomyces beijingensis]|uniref:Uncharacterized protein n=1 Tax=Lodderomyces beijingensis TaxID=1775926 RepID=A0ABP0ZNW7_9ASCO
MGDFKFRRYWSLFTVVLVVLAVGSIYNFLTISPSTSSAHLSSKGTTESPHPNADPAAADGSPYTTTSYFDEAFNFKKIEYEVKKKSPSSSSHEKPTILILSTIGKSEPYGPDRSVDDFFKTIFTLLDGNLSKFDFSIGILSNFRNEHDKVQKYLNKNNAKLSKYFSKMTLAHAPPLEEIAGVSREMRHEDAFQRVRRRLIAQCRNFLVSQALQNQQYILFLDTDIVSFDQAPQLLDIFYNSKKDIIVPRVVIRGHDPNPDYDLNSWRGQRTKPTPEQLSLLDSDQWDKFDYVPMDVPDQMFHFKSLSGNEDPEKLKLNHLEPLDSVGGAVLFMKSIIFRQGAIFPTSYIIGTTWDRSEGYDGIETEGICYLAKPLGYSCWGMPNIVAEHVGQRPPPAGAEAGPV